MTHGGDDNSDIETQEPVPNVSDIASVRRIGAVDIPPSEETPTKPSPDMNQKEPAKRSDYQSDEDDVDGADMPVDFGEEEEENGSIQFASPRISRETSQDTGNVASKAQEVDDDEIVLLTPDKPAPVKKDISEDEQSDIELDMPVKKAPVEKKGAVKKSVPAKKTVAARKAAAAKEDSGKEAAAKKPKKTKTSPKKTLSKKEKGSSPTKTIKKSAAESKAKTKQVRKKTVPKKGEQMKVNITALKDDGSSSADELPVKVNSKSTAAAKKITKPKKTISKEDKKGAKKSSSPTKATSKSSGTTSSKKEDGSKALLPKRKKLLKRVPDKPKNSAAGKATKSKATKSEKKGNTPTKSKGRKVKEEEVDSEVEADSEMELADSEGEEESHETGQEQSTDSGNRPYITCSSRDETSRALLDHAVQQLRGYNVIEYGPETVSKVEAYVIGDDTKRGWGILQALVNGVALISEKWLTSSISAGQWLPMMEYKSDRFGPREDARPENWGSKLLDGLRINVRCTGKDAMNVRKLVTMTGGRVAETRFDVVINDTKRPVAGADNVTKTWLADSIEAGEAMPYAQYKIDG